MSDYISDLIEDRDNLRAENDRLREALVSANETIVKLSQAFSIENDRLREALEQIAAENYEPVDESYTLAAAIIARTALAKEAGE